MKVLILVFVAWYASMVSGEMILAARGKPEEYVIIVPDHASESQRYAATELRDFVEKATNVRLPIVTDRIPLPPKAILLGGTRHNATLLAEEVTDSRLGAEGFRLVSRPPYLLIIGSSERGTLYGVYELLERFAGCRWYASWHTVVPQLETFAVPDNLDDTQTPAFEMRCNAWWDILRHNDFAARLRVNAKGWPRRNPNFDAKHGGNPYRFGGEDMGHTFYHFLSPQIYFKAHPEYFCEWKGERIWEKGNPCLTNPEVLRITTSNLIAAIRGNPKARIWSVSQMDTGKYCTCKSCRAVDEEEGSHAGTIIRFVNAVAENIEKDFPYVIIHTMAYQYSRNPPKTAPRRNVLLMMADIECDFARPLDDSPCPVNRTVSEELREWGKLTDRLMVWDYVTDFLHYTIPFGNAYALQGNLKFFHDNNVRAVIEQGDYQGRHADFAELKAWLLAKWMWNPNLPMEPLLEDFFTGYYGKAAPYVRTYFDDLHRLQLAYSEDPAHPLSVFTPFTNPAITDEFLENATKLWAKAIDAVKDDPSLSYNVRMGAFAVDYVRLMRMDKFALFMSSSTSVPYVAKMKGLAASLLDRMDEAKNMCLCENQARSNGYRKKWCDIVAGNHPRVFDHTGEIEDRHIECASIFGTRIDDPEADDGRALMLPGTHYEWSGRFFMRKLGFEQGTKYLLRVRVRVARRTSGEAFWAGVYDEGAKRSLKMITPKTADAISGYVWYDVHTWVPGKSDFFWIGPPRFGKDGKSAVNAVYVDKIDIVRIQK